MCDIINRSVTSVRESMQFNRIDVQLTELPRILGDPDHLGRVVINILRNAVQASPAHGTVRVTMGTRREITLKASDGMSFDRDEESASPRRLADPDNLNFQMARRDGDGVRLDKVSDLDMLDGHGDSPGWIWIRIEDEGGGITDEMRGRIFDPFFTTKALNQGTGLGLSICHGIVSGHNGKIDVESSPGRGANFVVYLPVPEGDLTRSFGT